MLGTVLGLLRTLVTDIAHLKELGTLDRKSWPMLPPNVDGNEHGSTELFSDGIPDVLTAVQDDTEQYASAEFLDENHQSRATLIPVLTALRLFLVRLNQSIDASQVDARLLQETAATRERPDD